MQKKVIYSSVFISILCGSNLFALNNNFYENSREGYFFYKDEKIVEEKEKDKKIIKAETSSIKSEYTKTKEMMDMVFETDDERAKRFKKEDEFMENIPFHKLDELSTDEYRRLLDVTRNISTGRPNKEFVKKYAAVQKFWVDKSENFAKSWGVANLENPDELLYSDIGWTTRDRVNNKKKKDQENKEFFSKIKSNAGYIVIIEDKGNKAVLQDTKLLYDKVKEETGLDYIIYDFYEVNDNLKKQLNLKVNNLPENYLLYVNNKKEKIYKRVAQGYSAANKIISNTKFVFENAILEEQKNPEHKLEKAEN